MNRVPTNQEQIIQERSNCVKSTNKYLTNQVQLLPAL